MTTFIILTHNDEPIIVNLSRIIMIMKDTDGLTYLRLTDGHGILVKESMEKIIQLLHEFKISIQN